MVRRLLVPGSLGLLLAAGARSAAAQQSRSDAVDRVVRSEMTRLGIPGLAIAVARGDTILKLGYYGYSDLDRRTPVSRTTTFAIASMSKAFTDAAILLLAEDGKLKLDDPVSRYLPTPPAWAPITLRQLMNHTAGLVDDWDHDWDEIPGYFMVNQSDSAFLAALYATPLVFPPGTRMEYGAGPFVLGVVATRVTGRPYAELIRDRIFRPLGMSGSYVNNPYARHPDAATGYLRWSPADSARPWPWLPAGSPPRGGLTHGLRISPAAEARGDVGISTTAEDMVKWMRALTGGGLLSRSSTEAMFSPTRLPSGDIEDGGLGWFQVPDRGGPVIAHGGNFRTGYSSAVIHHFRSGLTVIVMANLQSSVSDGVLADRLAGFYDADHAPIANRRPDAGSPAERAAVERALRAVAAARTDSAVMVPRFPHFYYGDRVRQTLVADSLTWLGCDDASGLHTAVQGYPTRRICYARLEGAAPSYIWATLTGNGLVSYIGGPTPD